MEFVPELSIYDLGSAMRVRLEDKVRTWPETSQKASQGHDGPSLFHPRPMLEHLSGVLGHREHRTTVNMIYKFKWKKGPHISQKPPYTLKQKLPQIFETIHEDQAQERFFFCPIFSGRENN